MAVDILTPAPLSQHGILNTFLKIGFQQKERNFMLHNKQELTRVDNCAPVIKINK